MNVGLKLAAAKKPDGGRVQRKMKFAGCILHLCAPHALCADVRLAVIAEKSLSVSSLTYLKLLDDPPL